MKLHIDERDIAIIMILWNSKKPMSSYAMAKKLYPELKDEHEISKKSIPIKSRVKKLSRYGFILNKTLSKNSYYSINKKNLKLGSGIVNFKYNYGKGNISMDKMVLLKSNDSTWRIIQIL